MDTSPKAKRRYRPRRPDEGHAKIHARVTPSARERACRAAEDLGWSVSQYVEALIEAQGRGLTLEQYLETLKPSEGVQEQLAVGGAR